MVWFSCSPFWAVKLVGISEFLVAEVVAGSGWKVGLRTRSSGLGGWSLRSVSKGTSGMSLNGGAGEAAVRDVRFAV